MLVSLSMKCWRQHKDRTITFTPGLNAMRGANEAGKTGVLLAIVYALFGVKAMPQPLAELTTWGCATRELKVTLILSIRGELYEFCRSESGAECKHSGGIVTGQNEVSKFAEELLGVDRTMATGMMFASQGGLRGALSEGPKALSQYIESLSGMDLFDRLLDRAAERLNTGPSRVIDEEIARMEADIEALDLTMPDVSAQNGEIGRVEAQADVLKRRLAGEAERLADAEEDLAAARTRHEVRLAAQKNLEQANLNLDRQTALVEKLKTEAETVIDTDRISALQDVLNGVEGKQVTASAYKAFLALPAHPDLHWDEGETTLAAEMKLYMDVVVQSDVEKAELNANIREAQAKRVNASACGYCGKDFSDVPEVAAANAKIDADCAAWQAQVHEWVAKREDALETHGTLRLVLESAKPFNAFLAKYADYVEANTNLVPPKITWTGEVPQALPNVAAIRAELADLQARQQAQVVARARLDQAQTTLYEYQQEVQRLGASQPAPADLAGYQAAAAQCREAVAKVRADLDAADKRILALEADKTRLFYGYEMNKQRWRDMSTALESKRDARKDLVFNNALVKKVRAARPIVAAKMWEIVLASVSTMFSKVRGTQSVVARTATGFTVNGHSVTGLSGSALDVLGMALRVALVKSFVPDCSFLILDEPFAACDEDRSASLIGFLTACDFDQTIVITHEAITEANANNLILI